MSRQNLAPIQFNRTRRVDNDSLMTSGRAGKVVPVGFIPLFRGDSASGYVSVQFDLADMPKPILNAVVANVQAWFVPKSALPQFGGYDEFIASYSGETIKNYPTGTRTPPQFFLKSGTTGAALTNLLKSTVLTSVGLHAVTGKAVNYDYLDAFTAVYNFRLEAHSSKLPKRKYVSQDNQTTFAENVKLPRGFWPHTRFSRIVPDYDRAIVVGDLSLDVSAGRLPVSGITQKNNNVGSGTGLGLNFNASEIQFEQDSNGRSLNFKRRAGNPAGTALDIWAEMEDTKINVTLANLDRARRTQAFARAAQAYAGNNWDPLALNNTVMAELMQGFSVPPEVTTRPFLLDAKLHPITMVSTQATDGESLGDSVTQGQGMVQLSLNVPRTETGGIIVITAEVGPERFFERQSDDYLHLTNPDELPNALRDTQRIEPVDPVPNHRIDAKHSNPNGIYGYEGMNDRWNRDAMRLGGVFYEPVPGAPWKEARSQIWLPDYVNPAYTSDHFLYPENLPHAVFADEEADAFEAIVRHAVVITGLTQIGDVLTENNGEYQLVEDIQDEN